MFHLNMFHKSYNIDVYNVSWLYYSCPYYPQSLSSLPKSWVIYLNKDNLTSDWLCYCGKNFPSASTQINSLTLHGRIGPIKPPLHLWWNIDKSCLLQVTTAFEFIDPIALSGPEDNTSLHVPDLKFSFFFQDVSWVLECRIW